MIIIPIENWSREFWYKLVIAKNILALKSGLKVILLPKNLVNPIIPLLRSVTILHKSIQSQFYDDIKTFKKNGNSFIYMEEETIHRNVGFNSARDSRFHQLTDHCFATTDEDYKSLEKLGFKSIKKIMHPRYYFAANAKKLIPAVFKESKASEKNKQRKQILFCSNFSLIFPPIDHNLERIIDDQSMSEEEEKSLKEFIEAFKKRALIVLNLLIQVSKSQKIIYRAHPLENFVKVKDFLKDSNIEVRKGGDVLLDLQEADEHWHTCCTSSVEAVLQKKDSYLIEILPSEIGSLPSKISGRLSKNLKYELLSASAAQDQLYKEVSIGLSKDENDPLMQISKSLVATSEGKKSNIMKNFVIILLQSFRFSRRLTPQSVEEVRLDKGLIDYSDIIFCEHSGLKKKFRKFLAKNLNIFFL